MLSKDEAMSATIDFVELYGLLEINYKIKIAERQEEIKFKNEKVYANFQGCIFHDKQLILIIANNRATCKFKPLQTANFFS